MNVENLHSAITCLYCNFLYWRGVENVSNPIYVLKAHPSSVQNALICVSIVIFRFLADFYVVACRGDYIVYGVFLALVTILVAILTLIKIFMFCKKYNSCPLV